MKKTAKKKPVKELPPVYRQPGQQQFTEFLRLNPALFNLTEMERICGFPSGTLRYVRSGKREMTIPQYTTIQEKVLPKLCEFVLLLQLYEGKYKPQSNARSWDDDDDDDFDDDDY